VPFISFAVLPMTHILFMLVSFFSSGQEALALFQLLAPVQQALRSRRSNSAVQATPWFGSAMKW
jgi:hypothetical protein